MNIAKLYIFSQKVYSSHPKIYSYLRGCYEIFQNISSAKYYLLRLFPIQKNKIVFDCNCGEQYFDNTKYVAEELLRRNKNYILIWLLNSRCTQEYAIPQKIKVVKSGSLVMAYHLATAKIWIDNVRMLSDVRKRKNQYYVQLWHGFGPKKLPVSSKLQIKTYEKDSNMTDIYVSCCSLLTKFYRELFYYHGEVLEIGYPRFDILKNGDRKNIMTKVSSKLNLPINKKIALFAPTWRREGSFENYFFQTAEYESLLSKLSKKYGGEWIILLRLHPNLASLSSRLSVDNTFVFNASNYLDMQELLFVSDILITDYSSCMFDFAVTRRPCFLYHPDIESFNDRQGFCIFPEELPFPRAHTNEELQDLIETFDEIEYRKTLDAYLEKIGFIEDGNASKAVVDWIEKKIEEDS